jgi:S-adenosylmethionine:tRNA ribosyltransferase-isomerase
MNLSDFKYSLPNELIAQYPLEDRGAARLLVLDRKTGEISHLSFARLVDFLNDDDVLVVNNTKVFKARLRGSKPTGGSVEVLLTRKQSDGRWEAMISHGKRVREGTIISFDGAVNAAVERKEAGARAILRFNEDAMKVAGELGAVPLPHYIKRDSTQNDVDRYQTVFAKTTGSIAAPTAGLHFTKDLLKEIRAKGIKVSELTLHIGPGTFKPIRTESIEKHQMEAEFYEIPEATRAAIGNAKRVFAVGTSVCRAIETYARTGEHHGWAELFIFPGYDFKRIDCLVTNFHLPGSTPLLMVCAFAGKDIVLKAYGEAVRQKYRFLSYGDAMLII